MCLNPLESGLRLRLTVNTGIRASTKDVSIPSNRGSVSVIIVRYTRSLGTRLNPLESGLRLRHDGLEVIGNLQEKSQSPRIGAPSPSNMWPEVIYMEEVVSIPSNRGSVSVANQETTKQEENSVSIPSNRGSVSV